MESLAGLELLPGGLYSNVKIQSQGGRQAKGKGAHHCPLSSSGHLGSESSDEPNVSLWAKAG